jgi:hypothetical protein
LKGLREASWLEDARITGPAAALHWVNQPMEAKLTRLEMQGTRLIDLEIEKLVQQDSRSGNQARQLTWRGSKRTATTTGKLTSV